MKDIIEIQEEVKIEQDDKKIILEKGDKIKVLKEASNQGYSKYVDEISKTSDKVISGLIDIIDNLHETMDEVQTGLGVLGMNSTDSSTVSELKNIIKKISASKLKNKY